MSGGALIAWRILIFFTLVVVGYLVHKGRMLGSLAVREVIKFNQDVCLPALVFVTTATRLTPAVAALDQGIGGPLLGLPLAGVLVCLGGWAIAELTAPLAGFSTRRAKGTYAFLLSFANATFLPVPLSAATRGPDGILFVALYTIGYFPLMWICGVRMLSGRWQWRFALHPALLAVLAGSVVGMAGWVLPGPVKEVLDLLGAMAIPLALVCVGALLAEAPLGLVAQARPLAAMVLVKLVAMPLAALAVVRAIGAPELIGWQAVLQAAMPCMAQGGLYAARFGGEHEYASRASFVTNLACLVTVPLVLGLAAA